MQLIDVLGDVGGLMEILFTFLNIISSLLTEILYDKSLVNDLFSFDIEKKMIVINKKKTKIKKSKDSKILDNNKKDKIMSPNHNILALDKNIDIFEKKNSFGAKHYI